MDTQAKLATLAKVAHALNDANVIWGLGASALLYFRDIVPDFDDFDLVIAPQSFTTAHDTFIALGAVMLPIRAPSATYATARFAEYRLENVDFDLLCEFALRKGDTVYRYPFDDSRQERYVVTLGETVPLCPLEDWLVLYLLMPGRADKASAIFRYLKGNPARISCYWLDRWLTDRLPGEVREKVMKLNRELWEYGQ